MSQRRTASQWSDERLDVFVGNLLRTGVLTAAAVVLVGGIIYLVRHGLCVAAFRRIQRRTVGSPLGERDHLRRASREAAAASFSSDCSC